jgi:hypothetical protein
VDRQTTKSNQQPTNNQPQPTTTNHNQPQQTTTNHNKPQQTTTNPNKPQQTTTNHNNHTTERIIVSEQLPVAVLMTVVW